MTESPSKTTLVQNQSYLLPALIMGGCLAVGMLGGSMILGHNAQVVAAAHESITVKGTAEKAIKADVATWYISISVNAKTIAEGLPLLKAKADQLIGQFASTGSFQQNQFQISDWNSQANYKQLKNNQVGPLIDYTLSESISSTFNDVSKPAQLNKVINNLIVQGFKVDKGSASYFASNIEQIKLSMIADATKNAHARAVEFAKSGGVEVGSMHSASQGVFDISRADDIGAGEGGGGNDTSSINKKARVVVTVEYGIK